MSGWAIGRIDEIEGARGWAPLRRHFDVGSFGVNAWRAEEAGASLIPEHDETRSRHEELYVVIAGSATFTVDGQTRAGPTGTVVFVRDPAVRRAAVADEAGTTILSVGAKPGEAYAPLAWEDNYDAVLLFQVEDYAGAKQRLLDALGRRPGDPGHLYNLACAEARLGERDAAIEHLLESVAQEPTYVGNAQADEDLASIRDDPRFPRPTVSDAKADK